MVEGAPLLREYRLKTLIEGSNPSLSAKNVFKLLNSIVIYYSSKYYPYFYPCLVTGQTVLSQACCARISGLVSTLKYSTALVAVAHAFARLLIFDCCCCRTLRPLRSMMAGLSGRWFGCLVTTILSILGSASPANSNTYAVASTSAGLK